MAIENTVKDIADATVGNLNKGTKWLLDLFDSQAKNLFEVVIYPQNLFGFKGFLQAGVDLAIARIYIQSLTVPFPAFTYETVNEKKYVKDIVFPDQVTFNFIENDIGFVRAYVNSWIEDIADKGFFGNNWTFKYNQKDSKKNAYIIPVMGLGIPSTAVFYLYGLKYMSMEEITLDQKDGDPMMLAVTCSVETTKIKSLL